MSNKRGFTLVELMAILVILSVLLLMSAPSITKTFKNSQETEEQEYQNILCNAAKTYLEVEVEGYTLPYQIPIDDLRAKGYILKSLTRPDTDELDHRKVSVARIGGKMQCELSS